MTDSQLYALRRLLSKRKQIMEREKIENEILTTSYFSQFKGQTFKEYWNTLPHKITYYDYEENIENILSGKKYLWIKKATGL